MACLFGHSWNGCTCTKCGKTRDKEHQFGFVPCYYSDKECEEQCKICGKKTGKRPSHDLIYLPDKDQEQCTRCGMTRKHSHKWIWDINNCQDECRLCGKTKEHHSFIPERGQCINKCQYCGKEIERAHDFWWDWEHCTEKCRWCGYIRPRHRWASVNGRDGCKCSVCGTSNESGIHDWDEWVTEGEYTHIKVCRLCGKRDESEKLTLEEGEKRRRAEREKERAMEWNDYAHEMAASGIKF